LPNKPDSSENTFWFMKFGESTKITDPSTSLGCKALKTKRLKRIAGLKNQESDGVDFPGLKYNK
jgi:hypothetical protein